MNIVGAIKEALHDIKIQLKFDWDRGAQMGKEMKKEHKEKIKKLKK